MISIYKYIFDLIQGSFVKFIKYYFETGNASDSAIKAGYKVRESAMDNLANPIIVAAIEELKKKNGLTDDLLLQKHLQLINAKRTQACNIYVYKDENGKWVVNEEKNEFIEVDDNYVQLGALKLAYEINGKLKHPLEFPPHTINVFVQNILTKAGLNGQPKTDTRDSEIKNRLN